MTVEADITLTGGGSVDPFDGERTWAHNAWTVTLRYEGREMALQFYTGELAGEPSAVDVLECLLSDASTVEAEATFDDWCADLGYDTDSRKAERTYNAVREQTDRLRQLLGDAFAGAVYPDDGDQEQAARRLVGRED